MCDSPATGHGFSSMTVLKSGDLVVLKSGGPIMTVDTVNTDIFNDGKITGVLCVWFVGDRLERVRFDHRAIEPIALQKATSKKKAVPSEEATGDYKMVLDEMVAAMNVPPDTETDAPRAVAKRPKSAPAHRPDAAAGSPIVNG
jgi:uncharacterized protein YodC (DUF2158 family)